MAVPFGKFDLEKEKRTLKNQKLRGILHILFNSLLNWGLYRIFYKKAFRANT